LTLRSVNGPAVTIVDGNGSARGFKITADRAVLDGFTITKCKAAGPGGAVWTEDCSPTVQNCIMSNNTASSFGGGLAAEKGGQTKGPLVRNCLIVDNTAGGWWHNGGLGYGAGIWFRGYGTETCPGTKVYTILGHIAHPGLIEVEMGTPLRTIIETFGGGVNDGKAFKGALIGGAAGAFVCPDCLDRPMDFDGLQELSAVLGSGAILVLDEDASIVDMLDGILEFFQHESCGQCAPCRAGTRALKTMMGAIRAGRGRPGDLDRLVEIASAMQAASLCPLGQSAIMPIRSALQHFRGEFESRISASVGAA